MQALVVLLVVPLLLGSMHSAVLALVPRRWGTPGLFVASAVLAGLVVLSGWIQSGESGGPGLWLALIGAVVALAALPALFIARLRARCAEADDYGADFRRGLLGYYAAAGVIFVAGLGVTLVMQAMVAK